MRQNRYQTAFWVCMKDSLWVLQVIEGVKCITCYFGAVFTKRKQRKEKVITNQKRPIKLNFECSISNYFDTFVTTLLFTLRNFFLSFILILFYLIFFFFFKMQWNKMNTIIRNTNYIFNYQFMITYT